MAKQSPGKLLELSAEIVAEGVAISISSRGKEIYGATKKKPKLEFEGHEEYNAISQSIMSLRQVIKPYLENRLVAVAEDYIEDADMTLIESKRHIAGWLSQFARVHGYLFAHPDSDEPCILLVINDKWGGKFVYENRNTKKRSHTTSDLTKLFPFRLCGEQYLALGDIPVDGGDGDTEDEQATKKIDTAVNPR